MASGVAVPSAPSRWRSCRVMPYSETRSGLRIPCEMPCHFFLTMSRVPLARDCRVFLPLASSDFRVRETDLVELPQQRPKEVLSNPIRSRFGPHHSRMVFPLRLRNVSAQFAAGLGRLPLTLLSAVFGSGRAVLSAMRELECQPASQPLSNIRLAGRTRPSAHVLQRRPSAAPLTFSGAHLAHRRRDRFPRLPGRPAVQVRMARLATMRPAIAVAGQVELLRRFRTPAFPANDVRFRRLDPAIQLWFDGVSTPCAEDSPAEIPG